MIISFIVLMFRGLKDIYLAIRILLKQSIMRNDLLSRYDYVSLTGLLLEEARISLQIHMVTVSIRTGILIHLMTVKSCTNV